MAHNNVYKKIIALRPLLVFIFTWVFNPALYYKRQRVSTNDHYLYVKFTHLHCNAFYTFIHVEKILKYYCIRTFWAYLVYCLISCVVGIIRTFEMSLLLLLRCLYTVVDCKLHVYIVSKMSCTIYIRPMHFLKNE